MQKILLLSNLHEELGRPGFRSGSYLTNLIPLARALEATGRAECRFLASPFVAGEIDRELDEYRLRAFEAGDLAHPGWQDFMVRSYRDTVPKDVTDDVARRLDALLEGWQPDVILCWEAPTDIFRTIYEQALVIDLMPGMFMRPPYPAMISLDPCGLYRDCWFRDVDVASVNVPDEVLADVESLRDTYRDHFKKLDIAKNMDVFLQGRILNEAQIAPLQIGAYFGWRDNTDFPDQAELIRELLRKTPDPVPTLVTHYTGALISEIVITPQNEPNFSALNSNLVFDPVFDRLNNITQYLIPSARRTVTVSSTLGLQAKFFGKELVSPSTSHLAYIAEATELRDLGGLRPRPLEGFMAAYLGRTNVLRQRLTEDGEYALGLIEEMQERHGEIGVERFPDFATVGNTASTLLEKSNLAASKRHFDTHFGAKTSSQHAHLRHSRRGVSSPEFDVVSFDVFDTLLCRTVAAPTDIFALMQTRLERDFDSRFPAVLVARFSDFRMGAERLLRRRLDLRSGPGVEEMTITDVYDELAGEFDLGPDDIQTLTKLEQEVELGCLVRSEANAGLYAAAGRAGKRRIIVSDFIHPADFVERALRQAGYDGWERIFVSSEHGRKKHSGALYDLVLKEIGVTADRMLHVGDNEHGDIAMAEDRGLSSLKVPRAPKLALDLMTSADYAPAVVNRSVRLGSQLALFANTFCGTEGRRAPKSRGGPQMIETAEEAGFLALGPPMLDFARFILAKARERGCTQIALFARDTYLPYRILAEILAERGEDDIQLCYLLVSRISVTGVDVFTPEDLWNVRIDDFRRNEELVELLQRRFGLRRDEICGPTFETWTSGREEDAPLKVADVPALAIYRMAVESAKAHRDAFIARMDAKRVLFDKGLKEWGCDVRRKTLTVDIGYKGSIHKKIRHMFKDPPEAAMFISYCDSRGAPPLKGTHIFYAADRIPSAACPLPAIRNNLILETLLNEGQGSVTGYAERHGRVIALRDEGVPAKHRDTIEELHGGALEFAKRWRAQCGMVEDLTAVTPADGLYFLDQILTRPETRAADIMRSLSYDNAYSGHRQHTPIGPPSQRANLPTRLGPLFAFAAVAGWVRLMHSKKTYNAFIRDPEEYMLQSRRKPMRSIGRRLFP